MIAWASPAAAASTSASDSLDAASDGDVLDRWLSEPDADGAITLTVFRRYRDILRCALQAHGLSRRRAVELVAEVLVRARSARSETTLCERLLACACEVAREFRDA